MTEPVRLNVLAATSPSAQPPQVDAELLGELQVRGIAWSVARAPGLSRVGGAGPSDHKALQVDGHTIMVPIFSATAGRSPFGLEGLERAWPGEQAWLTKNGQRITRVRLVPTPRFYRLRTKAGVPYYKIATLHSDRVLATTVLQNCFRYARRETSCQFCAIGSSLASRQTIPKKSPAQLAEVAEAAVRLDAVEHMVLTTGTPPTADRGALLLTEAALAITARVPLPLQAQCEPPADPSWFGRLKDAGVVTLGMHLEVIGDSVRQRIMPGKAEVSVAEYFRAFERAVAVFGRGQVTTYILAGLGDPADTILQTARRLAQLGVYSFVVPFVPLAGTPLADHPPPDHDFMERVLGGVAEALALSGLTSSTIKAGCGRCGACSSLKARERTRQELGHA